MVITAWFVFRHGVSRTDEYILKDPHLSFYKYAKMHADQNAKDEATGVAVTGKRTRNMIILSS